MQQRCRSVFRTVNIAVKHYPIAFGDRLYALHRYNNVTADSRNYIELACRGEFYIVYKHFEVATLSETVIEVDREAVVLSFCNGTVAVEGVACTLCQSNIVLSITRFVRVGRVR